MPVLKGTGASPGEAAHALLRGVLRTLSAAWLRSPTCWGCAHLRSRGESGPDDQTKIHGRWVVEGSCSSRTPGLLQGPLGGHRAPRALRDWISDRGGATDQVEPCVPVMAHVPTFTTFMRGPLLSEAVAVDLEALQSLHWCVAPAAPQFPAGTSSRLGAELGHSHPPLLSAAQETPPRTLASHRCVCLVPFKGCSGKVACHQAPSTHSAGGIFVLSEIRQLGTESFPPNRPCDGPGSLLSGS